MKTDGITFLGDVFLPKPYKSELPWMHQYVYNLESPITQSNSGYPGKINLKADSNYSADTFGHAPIAVSMANNHILDFMQVGLRETIDTLRDDEVQYFGAGTVSTNCNNPALIGNDGRQIALLGYACESTTPVLAHSDSPGVAPINLPNIKQDIFNAKEQGASRVVVSLHWGAENIYLPKPLDVNLAHEIIDAGADLLIGHHAHCIQPWELYNGKYIFYGLGNCIFPDIDVPAYYQDGEPTTIHSIKNRFWNNKSLAVEYFPDTNEVKIRKLAFDGEKVKTIKEIKNVAKKSFQTGSRYRKRFHRAFIIGKIKWILFRYLENPKLPSLKHIRALANMVTDRLYK